MDKIKSMLSNLVHSSVTKNTCLLLVGYLFSMIVTPQQSGKVIKSGLTTSCNTVFQHYLCSAVGLKKQTVLSTVYAYSAPEKMNQVKQPRVAIKPTVKPQPQTVTVSQPYKTYKSKPFPKQETPDQEHWSENATVTARIFSGGGDVPAQPQQKPKKRLTLEEQ